MGEEGEKEEVVFLIKKKKKEKGKVFLTSELS